MKQMIISSRSTTGQICAACPNSIRHKGVLNGYVVFHQFLLIKQRYLNGFRGYFHRSCNLEHIVSFGIYCSVLEWGEGIGGLGRPSIKFELCPFVNYSSFMEKGAFVLYFIFHQFRTNLLDMPHWTWRKISQIWNLMLCLGMGEGIGRLGRPYIKFELCPFAIYSCVMERGVYVSCFIFH